VSRDPLGYVDGLGLHEAFGGNPVNYFDPEGTSIWDKIKKIWQKKGEILKLKNKIAKAAKDFKNLNVMYERARKEIDRIDSLIKSYEKIPCPTDQQKKVLLDLAKESKRLKEVTTAMAADLKKLAAVEALWVKDLKKLALALVAANSLNAANNPNATEQEIISSALWDVAVGIDPLGITNVIEWASGLDEGR